jgi:hypothetical protein
MSLSNTKIQSASGLIQEQSVSYQHKIIWAALLLFQTRIFIPKSLLTPIRLQVQKKSPLSPSNIKMTIVEKW